MGKKRRMLSSAKHKGKRTTLWEAMNTAAELSARVDELVERVEALTAPLPTPVVEVLETVEVVEAEVALAPTPRPKAIKAKTRTAKTTRVKKTKTATKKTSKFEN